MEEQEVAARLVSDIEANMTWLQLGGITAAAVLALVGVVLAMRAYTVLSEARQLYWKASALSEAAGAAGSARAARAEAIKAASSKKKLRSNRVRGVM